MRGDGLAEERPDARTRLLLLIGGMGPAGAEKQARLLLENLPRDRIVARLTCFRGPEEVFCSLRAAGVAVDILPRPRRRIWPLTTLRFLNGVIRRQRIQVVHAFLPVFAILAPLLRVANPRLRIVTGRRSLDEYLTPGEIRLLRIAGRHASVIVANSQAVAESVRRLEGGHGGRLRVIPNGIALPPPVDAAERAAARARFGLADRDFVIGYLAHFRHGKGHDHLLETARRLAPVLPESRFLLAGDTDSDASYRTNYERFAGAAGGTGVAERIRCLGKLPDSRPLLAASDVMLNLSDMEGMSNTIMEAMAAGLPVVATAVGGTPELIEEGREGYLVPAAGADAAAERLARLAHDAEARRRMGEAGRRRIGTEFSIEKMAGSYLALYEDLRPR